jgi:hypothetical protein
VLGLLSTRPAAAQDHQVVGVYAIWFAGHGDGNRAELDRFFECLVDGSNLNSYWQGEAGLEFRGSWALAAPAEALAPDEVAGWLALHVAAGAVPPARVEEIPLYVVIGGQPKLALGSCGRVVQADVGGRHSGVALVRNAPLCWPTGDTLRTETQIAMHEIVETADALLGYAACAADGACEGAAECEGRCATFVGLTCPGAPTASWTGCDGGQVDGWVVQKLSYAGRLEKHCGGCVTCDFTPLACAAGDPTCAAVPARQSPPVAATGDGGGCGGSGARPISGGLFLLLMSLLALGAVSRRVR